MPRTPEESFQNLLRLSPEARKDLLRRMDNAPPGARAAHRKAPRFAYHQASLPLTLTYTGGRTSRFLVSARNLSTNGMSFLHGGYVHPGTTCRIVLPAIDGSAKAVLGKVTACRHVAGHVHEVCVNFYEKIDIDRYCPPETRVPAGMREDELRPATTLPKLDGAVLVLAAGALERRVLTLRLAALGLAVVAVENIGHAIDQVRRLPFDVALCEAPKAGADPAEDPARRLPDCGFTGQIVGLGTPADADGEWTSAHDLAGFIARPFAMEAIIPILRRALLLAGDRPGAGEIRSTLNGGPGAAAMVRYFVEAAAQCARQLEDALESDHTARARAVCETLSTTAGGYGFASIAEAARHALKSLHESGSPAACEGPMRLLITLCRRVRGDSSEAGPAARTGARDRPGMFPR